MRTVTVAILAMAFPFVPAVDAAVKLGPKVKLPDPVLR